MDDVFAEARVCRTATEEGWDILNNRRRIAALYEEMKRIDVERHLVSPRAPTGGERLNERQLRRNTPRPGVVTAPPDGRRAAIPGTSSLHCGDFPSESQGKK